MCSFCFGWSQQGHTLDIYHQDKPEITSARRRSKIAKNGLVDSFAQYLTAHGYSCEFNRVGGLFCECPVTDSAVLPGSFETMTFQREGMIVFRIEIYPNRAPRTSHPDGERSVSQNLCAIS
jgi:hypothetical protein